MYLCLQDQGMKGRLGGEGFRSLPDTSKDNMLTRGSCMIRRREHTGKAGGWRSRRVGSCLEDDGRMCWSSTTTTHCCCYHPFRSRYLVLFVYCWL